VPTIVDTFSRLSPALDPRFGGLNPLSGGGLLGMKPVGCSPCFGGVLFQTSGFRIGSRLLGEGGFERRVERRPALLRHGARRQERA